MGRLAGFVHSLRYHPHPPQHASSPYPAPCPHQCHLLHAPRVPAHTRFPPVPPRAGRTAAPPYRKAFPDRDDERCMEL
ncbi:hypothetical protein BDZ91DRAFT_710241 [Kalaharituber pfeilii]|nr:hypothetical protein BDZ91DRAFT_710241 [Kalaharituber pfeilii]